MINIVKKNSLKGNNINEDLLYVDPENRFVILLDGASGLEQSIVSKKSDARWYVNKFKHYFIKYFDIYQKPATVIKHTINSISEDYYIKTKTNDISSIYEPSASGAILIDRGNHLNLYYFGDVMTYVVSEKNNITTYYDKKLTSLDEGVFNLARNEAKNKMISFKEAINNQKKNIVKNRLLKNKDEGYYIFSLNDKVISKINRRYQIKKDRIRYILLMSDGFYTRYNNKSAKEIFNIVLKAKNNIVRNIKEDFIEDKNFEKYNRFKEVDDITYCLIKICD